MNTALPTAQSTYDPSLDNLRSLLIIRSIVLPGQTGVPEPEFDPVLGQAFENLLNNAADSGSDRVGISYR